MERMPNFLVIGAAKTGTTSLHNYLGQHPEIFMSENKEPAFFAHDGRPETRYMRKHAAAYVTDLDAYQGLFDDVRDETAVGESSPQYLEFAGSGVVERIERYVPEARLIATIRQPVERAFSSYVMNYADDGITMEAFAARIRQDWARGDDFGQLYDGSYNFVRSYARRLSVFLDRFDRARIKLCLFDDIVADTPVFVRDIFAFLEVDENATIGFSTRHNETKALKDAGTRMLLRRPNPIRYAARKLLPSDLRIALRTRIEGARQKKPPRLDPELRRELSQPPASEIRRLEELLDRDLSHWLT